jgi:hypothetical protein
MKLCIYCGSQKGPELSPTSGYCSDQCRKTDKSNKRKIRYRERYNTEPDFRKKLISKASDYNKKNHKVIMDKRYESDPDWKSKARREERAKTLGISYDEYMATRAIKDWGKPKPVVQKTAPAWTSHSAHFVEYCKQIGCASHVDLRRKQNNRDTYYRKVVTVEGVVMNRMKTRLRQVVQRQLKRTVAHSVTLSKIGYTPEMLVDHLAKTMPDGATWDDFFSGDLHIDHDIPCAAFDLSKKEHVMKAYSLSNLKLMWASDNLSKNSKYAGVRFSAKSKLDDFLVSIL